MFGFRSDGKKVKGMNIIDKAGPFFMNQRIDAVNYFKAQIPCNAMDEFIARERRNGNHYTYMHLMFATLVRVLYTRKKMNRFIMRGTTYQRNTISISMDIKKKLEDEGDNVTCKFYFTGRESLAEIKSILDEEIAKNLKVEEVDKTTKVAKILGKLPDCMFRGFMAIARFLDRHGMLPKFLIKASPFHTSLFITNLKSIKLSYIYHHLYNFGTTSIFVAMGKEKLEPYVDTNKEVKVGKFLTVGFSLDERIADGLYMGKTLKLIQDLLTNPDSLAVSMPDDGTIPKKLLKKKAVAKVKKSKKTKDKKPKKIKPLKNKEKLDKKLKKQKEKQENKGE